MSVEEFVETTSRIARGADVMEATVRGYCDRGLIEHKRLSSGMRLLKPSAVQRVRELKAQGLARCGRYQRESTASHDEVSAA